MPVYWAGLWLGGNDGRGAARRPGGDEGLGGGAGVARDEDPAGSGERDEGVADKSGRRLVELVGVDAPDVVGLEDDVERRRMGGHAPVNLPGGSGGSGGSVVPTTP